MSLDAEIDVRFHELLMDWYQLKVGRTVEESYAVFSSCRPGLTLCKGPNSLRPGTYLKTTRKNRCNNLLCPVCLTWRLGVLLNQVIYSNAVYFSFKQLGYLDPSQPLTKDQIVDWEERNQGRIPGEYLGWAGIVEVGIKHGLLANYTRVGLWSTSIDPRKTPLRHRLGFETTHWYDKHEVGLWFHTYQAQDIVERFRLAEDILDMIEPVEAVLATGVMGHSEYLELVEVHHRESPLGKTSRF